ncbi:MAG: large terminal subunit of phenylpropionate dioxygenase [Candidatus Eremiobacteraeota bacterium]|nr:large terminal subunit of phenylpropionate dioxygenase [Candidatus Eremiobacteraeota bacterium]
MDTLPRPIVLDWETDACARIPYRLYTDAEIYARELERFFYSGHWCYVGLVAEIPNAGDFKRSAIGERGVVVVRGRDGAINVVENRCAHRGVQFCQKGQGNTKTFVCPYHQWSYDLKGNLIGLPFRKGVRQGDRVNGGMPEDFELAEHGLTQLAVEVWNGVVFASFDRGLPPVREFVGPEVGRYFERVFDGRELTLLGYSRQRIPGNWKLMMENIKDPYHPGLLHTWFVTFGLWRADQQSEMIVDACGRHAAMVSRKNDGGRSDAVTAGVTSFKENMVLHDDRVLDVVVEPWWNGPTVTMLTLFPSLIVQQQVNSLSTRHIIPTGTGSFDFVWTHFGFAADDAEMTRRRLRQANLFGPAGYVSADDGEVIEFSQRGYEQHGDLATVCELGGRGRGGADHNVTETLIRSMYGYYREVMEL